MLAQTQTFESSELLGAPGMLLVLVILLTLLGVIARVAFG